MSAGFCHGVVLVAPQPYNPAQADSFDFRTEMDWSSGGLLSYAQPQLFFQCTVCPTGSLRLPRQHKELTLVFFSTFEPIKLTPNVVMQRNGVPMFYDMPAALTSPPCTFAWLGMSWAGCHSRHASYE